MKQLPHHYKVSASAAAAGNVELSSDGLPALSSGPPAEFGGSGDLWSPETLLVGALADCYVLTFRAVARASSFPWLRLSCDADGTVDRSDGATRFTRFVIRARLVLAAGGDEARGRRLLEKAKSGCIIGNSLRAEYVLEPTIEFS